VGRARRVMMLVGSRARQCQRCVRRDHGGQGGSWTTASLPETPRNLPAPAALGTGLFILAVPYVLASMGSKGPDDRRSDRIVGFGRWDNLNPNRLRRLRRRGFVDGDDAAPRVTMKGRMALLLGRRS
jgi:hypothetical protein